MKKVLSAIFLLIICLTLVGCKTNKKNSNDDYAPKGDDDPYTHQTVCTDISYNSEYDNTTTTTATMYGDETYIQELIIVVKVEYNCNSAALEADETLREEYERDGWTMTRKNNVLRITREYKFSSKSYPYLMETYINDYLEDGYNCVSEKI